MWSYDLFAWICGGFCGWFLWQCLPIVAPIGLVMVGATPVHCVKNAGGVGDTHWVGRDTLMHGLETRVYTVCKWAGTLYLVQNTVQYVHSMWHAMHTYGRCTMECRHCAVCSMGHTNAVPGDRSLFIHSPTPVTTTAQRILQTFSAKHISSTQRVEWMCVYCLHIVFM